MQITLTKRVRDWAAAGAATREQQTETERQRERESACQKFTHVYEYVHTRRIRNLQISITNDSNK